MGVLNPNSTPYVHPNEPNLLNIHKAMEYRDGIPHLRVNLGSDNITITGDVNLVDNVRVNNSTTNPVPVFLVNNTVTILNTSFAVTNFPTTSTVYQGTDPWRTTVTNWPALQYVNGTLYAVQSGTWSVGVTGNVTVSNFTSTVNVASLPAVSGTVAVSSLPAITGTVTVSNFTSTVNISNTVTIANTSFAVTNFPTTSTVYQGTSPWVVQGSVTISAQPESATFEFTSKNRLKVSTYQTVFFNTFQYSKETDVWDEALYNGGTATFIPDQSSVELKVTNQQGSKVIRQTFNAQRYIPGRTSTLNFAVRMQNPTVGIRRRFGLFDERDGCYFEDAGDGHYYCVLRSYASGSLVENRVERAAWNGERLDGSFDPYHNVTGITANPEAIHMFGVEYEWYGAGQVKFVYIIGGVSHTIHTFNTANVASLPWCTTPFLPIRLEIENTTGGQTGNHYLWQGSNSLISEGVPEKLGIAQSITSPVGGTALQTKEVFYPVLSIRLKSTAIRGVVLPSFFQAASTDNTNIYYKLVRNATLTGAVWTDMPDTNSFTQYDVSATAFSGGVQIDSGFVFGSAGGTRIALDQNTVYQIGRSSLGTVSDTYTLCVASSIANKSAVAQMTWIEQR